VRPGPLGLQSPDPAAVAGAPRLEDNAFVGADRQARELFHQVIRELVAEPPNGAARLAVSSAVRAPTVFAVLIRSPEADLTQPLRV
jgi:hypothetical protein